MKVLVDCPKCGQAETEVLDSVPYCPTCRAPITPEQILPQIPKGVESV